MLLPQVHPGFATVTAPLTELTKATERIKSTLAWKALQQAMASYPILRPPESGKEYFVDTAASNVGLGAELWQRGKRNTAPGRVRIQETHTGRTDLLQ